MDKKFTKLIKDMIWNGLQRANFDVKSAMAITNRIMIINDDELRSAQRNAIGILQSMQGANDLPTEMEQLENYVDGKIAELNFVTTVDWIGKELQEKTDKEYIQECLEAIQESKRVDGKFAEKVELYQRTLDNQIEKAKKYKN